MILLESLSLGLPLIAWCVHLRPTDPVKLAQQDAAGRNPAGLKRDPASISEKHHSQASREISVY